ncbi:MAG: hypothetical protein J5846_01855 [Desulfovibrio sp.]|nr:hypothetical protein [Desulfovibrio sp.]
MALIRRSRQHRRTPEKTQAAPERFCLRVTAPLLGLGSVLLILTLGWAFLTGFLVGRGENPGERLAILAPFAQENNPEPAQEKQVQPEAQKEVASEQAPLPEPQPEPAQLEVPKNQEPAAHPFTRPDASSMAAWGARTQPEAAEKTAAASAPAQRFAYQLRIATFSRREEAEALGRKITGKGVNCQVVQHGKLFVLGCALRGTAQDYADFSGLLTRHRVKDPVLVVKKELKAR